MLSGKCQGKLRPMIKAAWATHCGQVGEDAANPLAYRAWYEDVLHSAAGIRSTREASDAQLDTLLEAFRVVGAAGCGMRDTGCGMRETGCGRRDAGETPALPGVECRGFSEAQNKVFAALLRKATAAAGQAAVEDAVREAGLSRRKSEDEDEDENEKRKGHECPAYRCTDRTEAFDRVMANLAVLAMDEYWMERTSGAAERRVHFIIQQTLSDISELTGTVHDWEYARGVYAKMRLPLRLEDTPAALGIKVFQALDVYRRRLGKRRSEAGETPALPDDVPF
jgi:hypothetical protein